MYKHQNSCCIGFSFFFFFNVKAFLNVSYIGEKTAAACGSLDGKTRGCREVGEEKRPPTHPSAAGQGRCYTIPCCQSPSVPGVRGGPCSHPEAVTEAVSTVLTRCWLPWARAKIPLPILCLLWSARKPRCSVEGLAYIFSNQRIKVHEKSSEILKLLLFQFKNFQSCINCKIQLGRNLSALNTVSRLHVTWRWIQEYGASYVYY